MASEQTDIIDETPISPVRSSERRNSLEKHLQHRPEPQDLKNRHIVLDTTTAPYVPSHMHLRESYMSPIATLRRKANMHVTAPSKPKPSSWNASAQPTISSAASTLVPSAPSS